MRQDDSGDKALGDYVRVLSRVTCVVLAVMALLDLSPSWTAVLALCLLAGYIVAAIRVAQRLWRRTRAARNK